MRAGRLPNLFLYYHDDIHEDRAFENLLTEVTAFFLSCDRTALASFCAMILGDGGEQPIHIETQAHHTIGTPDIVVRLVSGKLLIVENKTESPLHPGQLETYLELLRTTGGYLALISNKRQSISGEVLSDAQYRRPPGRAHFTWRDMYAWVRSLGGESENPIRSYFGAYLESLGYAPSNLPGEWRRLFEVRTEPVNQKLQVEFGDILFNAVEALFKQSDFELSRVSHKGWQATPGPNGLHRYRHLVVLPLPSRAGLVNDERRHLVSRPVLAVGLVYERIEDAEAMYAAAQPVFREGDRDWVTIPPHAINSDRWRLEFATALEPFLANDEHIVSRLRAGLGAVLQAMWRVERERIALA